MNWSNLGRGLRLAFYLRIPLLTMLLIASLGPLSQFSSANSLLGNLLDQQTDDCTVGWNIFVVSFATFLLALTAVTTLNLTLYYGTERFNDEVNHKGMFCMRQSRPGFTFICGLIAALSLITSVIWRTEGGHTWIKIGCATAALAAAMLATLFSKIVQLALTNPEVTPHPPPFLVFPIYRWRWLESKLDTLYCWPGPGFLKKLKNGGGRLLQRPFRMFEGAAQGYLTRTAQGNLVLASGHVFALTLAALAFITYFILGWGKERIIAGSAVISGLAFVLLFFLVACWVLSALAFFLDRYHVPLLVSIVVLASLTSSSPESDHFFRVETDKSVPRLIKFPGHKYSTPREYLASRAADGKHNRIIIVATPGGGIQAAAWTAAVLSGLGDFFKDDDQGHGFRQSVAMISSVSGGSLGAMIYANSFTPPIGSNCASGPKNDPGKVTEHSMRSAIDEVAWGWTSPDVWRAIVPLFQRNLAIDRGWALEQKWAVVNGLSAEPDGIGGIGSSDACNKKNGIPYDSPEGDTYLSDWVVQGPKLPALVMNSTLVESGRHVVFSTTRFPGKTDSRGIENFYDLFPNKTTFDIRVNTAARLSASFPYVAPAARPIGLDSIYGPEFHFVDGGYYDNLGVDSTIGWLDSAYPENPPLPDLNITDILILQIRHFNSGAAATGSTQGWGFQLGAPLAGFFNTWDNSPAYRDKNELDLFLAQFNARKGPKLTTVTIPYCGMNYKMGSESKKDRDSCLIENAEKADYTRDRLKKIEQRDHGKAPNLDCADQPLSWKLSQSQKTCVQCTWKEFLKYDPTGAIQSIGAFLDGK